VRLVVDTNLMIRALLSPGPARQFLKLAPLSHQLLYHLEQIAELREVATRPRLKIAQESLDELAERIEFYGLRIDSDLNATSVVAIQKTITCWHSHLRDQQTLSSPKTKTCLCSIRGREFA
jgi:predicted nucleic acid-binding protein